MTNPKKIITLLLICFSTLSFAENEVRYDTRNKTAILPHVIIPDYKGGAEHYRIELKKSPDGTFSVSQADVKDLSRDDSNLEQITIKSGFVGSAAAGTLLKETSNHPQLEVRWPKVEVLVYPENVASDPSGFPFPDAIPIASTFADHDGFYQIETEQEVYRLCFKPSGQNKQVCGTAGVGHAPFDDKSRGPWQECYFDGNFDENDDSGELEGNIRCAN